MTAVTLHEFVMHYQICHFRHKTLQFVHLALIKIFICKCALVQIIDAEKREELDLQENGSDSYLITAKEQTIGLLSCWFYWLYHEKHQQQRLNILLTQNYCQACVLPFLFLCSLELHCHTWVQWHWHHHCSHPEWHQPPWQEEDGSGVGTQSECSEVVWYF